MAFFSTIAPPNLNNPWSRFLLDIVRAQVDRIRPETPPRIDPRRHNFILEQARLFQKRVMTLSGLYAVTGETPHLETAWALCEDCLGWPDWYWKGHGPEFDLATGELAMALAFVDETLGDGLDPARRTRLREAIRVRILEPYLNLTRENPGTAVWWYRAGMNWNTVCNGGAWTAATLFREEDPDLYRKVKTVAWAGLETFTGRGVLPDGSSPESIGYWMYGVSYWLYALLRFEAVESGKRPEFDRTCLNRGILFPFDFSPRGTSIGFGDANQFKPEGILMHLAARTGHGRLTTLLKDRLRTQLEDEIRRGEDPITECRPDAILALLATPAEEERSETPPPALTVYPDVGWSVFRVGDLSLSFRAGTTDAPHSMRDLLSVNLAKAGVRLLESVENWPYQVGWFSHNPRPDGRHPSREMFFEDRTDSKSTLLPGSMGQCRRTATVWKREGDAVRADATEAYPVHVVEASRKITVNPDGFVLEDTLATTGAATQQIRFLTLGEWTPEGPGAYRLTTGGASCLFSFTADAPLAFLIDTVHPSIPGKVPLHILRVFNKEVATKVVIRTRIQ